ncbi:MAG: biosynthetic arginine decarboxylase [Phocaeicola plebeius]
MRKWRIEDSEELYNITGWGVSYFSINDQGHVVVTPRKDGVAVDLKELVDELQLRDVTAPMLVRFPDILDNRIEKISNCFDIASKEYGYKGENFCIYPIKVNQMRPVVEEIISHGKKFNLGLEAGSKPELHAVIAINTDSDSLIICNGYKDESYIELALLAQKMGKRIFLVVEKLNELRLIAKMAKQLNVRPNIGIRIKLASSGSGKWEESGGDASKFGLTSSELLEALDFIEKKELKDCLKLIHFHIGSQVTKIRRIKTALREASQFYVQLHQLGFSVEFVDIGGGLGVDYDGTRSSNSESSVNYSIQEYVNDSISIMVDASNKNGIPHPNIINESGRSLTAHHSVLIFEVLETASLPEMDEEFEVSPNDHELVQELYQIWDTLTPPRMLEAWHDAQQIREETLDLFSHGIVDLKTRAQIERLFWSVCREMNRIIGNMKHVPDEFRKLDKLLADKYFCNFSLFQSLPDSWAIDQIFPIMPIQRLDERPDRTATLQDITCDSDGKIANFVSGGSVTHYLPVHTIKGKESYYIGVFLVGAYQEILGDMHNLFGDTNAVHVSVNDKGYSIDQVIDGETVAEVLDYVQYNSKKLVRTLETWVTKSVKEGRISLDEGKEFLANYRSGLYGYTYLE